MVAAIRSFTAINEINKVETETLEWEVDKDWRDLAKKNL
jgi:hypothetical protein